MLIKEMNDHDIHALLHQTHLGRVAYVIDNKPYITPMMFAFNAGALYSFTTDGQKVAAMRKNADICIMFDQIRSLTNWSTVLVHGTYRELAEDSGKTAVAAILEARPQWWEPAYVRTIMKDGTARGLSPIYFRVDINRLSGHQAD